MPIITVADASFGYNSADIFTNISFSVAKGELFCLLGPNGSGKTTLLDCILGMLKLRQGEIFINGKDSRSFRAGRIARHIAYVPQRHERTFPYRVLDIVTMGRAAYTGLFSGPSREDKSIAARALETVGISRLRDRPYTQLSGGEGQLVMIARALAQETPVIIVDEPTAHLDFRNDLLVLETIGQLVRETGRTVMMATHFPHHAFYFKNNGVSTTVALLHKGGFLAIGDPDEVLTTEQIRMLYGVETCMVSCSTGKALELKQRIPTSTVPCGIDE
jgi:iron complex transport system ATP-binding protein